MTIDWYNTDFELKLEDNDYYKGVDDYECISEDISTEDRVQGCYGKKTELCSDMPKGVQQTT